MKTTTNPTTKTNPNLSPLRLAALVLLSSVSACMTGSGRLETKSFAVEEFDAIETDNAVKLEVTRADRFDVAVTTDDNMWEALDVSREGKTLRVRLRPGIVYSGVTLRASVSMPVLVGLDVAGAGQARLTGFDARLPRFSIHASGSSTVEGRVNADELSLHLSGLSKAELTGAAMTVTIKASGGSDADLAKIPAAAASVALSGGSAGAVTVERSLDYDLSGGSHLDYFGDPKIGASHTSGGSTVSRL